MALVLATNDWPLLWRATVCGHLMAGRFYGGPLCVATLFRHISAQYSTVCLVADFFPITYSTRNHCLLLITVNSEDQVDHCLDDNIQYSKISIVRSAISIPVRLYCVWYDL